MNNPDDDPKYTMGRSREETDRLIRQSRLYEGLTRRFLKEAGLVSGMRVLDIGSGAGDVALAATELVGPAGQVVGVDVNGKILETARVRVGKAGWTNVEFVAGDARTLDLGGDFDALVGRFVLMYMSDPSEALKQFAGCLRPGGIVVFQEIDFMFRRSFHPPNTPLAKKLIGWAIAVFERSGAHTRGGSSPCAAFTSARLTSRQVRFVALSQLAKSAMNFRMILRNPSSGLIAVVHPDGRPCMPRRILRAFFLNASGQCSSHGSGSSSAINTARDEASGRRAHHRCRVEGCPCRIDFSRAACFETSAMGKSTSASRLHSLGITGSPRPIGTGIIYLTKAICFIQKC